MDDRLRQDLLRFFSVYDSRTADLRSSLPLTIRKELDEEFSLLKASVLNRLEEESR